MNDRPLFSRFVAGLQAGMAGALVMLAWLAITMLWYRNSIWWFPNLMATTFGGDPALHPGFGKYSPAGIALHLVQFSVLGGLFAITVPQSFPYLRLLLLGVLAGLGYYFVMYDFAWKHLNSLIPLYAVDRPTLVGHLLYGLMLARAPRYLKASVSESR